MAKSKAFTKAAFLSAAGATIKPVRLHLPELDGDVFIKRHTLAEREEFNERVTTADKHDQNAIGVQLVTCYESGGLLFEPTDIDAIKGLPSNVTTEILYKYNVINGLVAPINEQVEDAKKNS